MSNRERSPTVALIGCGPSGMFFLHALATERRQMEYNDSNCTLPIVACFESSPCPGGVWKSDRDGGTANMYEALWTNGPHYAMEFFDHTYDEHFGCALPMYLPRKLVLEYLLARVTKNDDRFFDQVNFNTTVESVKYDDEISKFVVQTLDKNTGSVSITHFDKCIWAGGNNGKPHIPTRIADALASFRGKIMHSSQTDKDFDTDVRDKSVLIVGDNYSAEDLTLQAIKLGVENVTICSRSGMGMAYYTEAWPGDKVDVHYGFLPTGVTEDGYGVILTKSEYDFDKDEYVETSKTKTVEVDTIIYCTGYDSNYGMLDASLRPDGKSARFSKDDLLADWKMTHNPLSEELGDVPVGRIKDYWLTQKDIFRGVLISNPNMMFVRERCDVPLFDLDVQTWLLLAHITENNLPSIKEMNEWNREQFAKEMDTVMLRYHLDMNYKEKWWNVDDDHWSYNHFDDRSMQNYQQYYDLQYRILARDMTDAKYPLNIGTYEQLNDTGEALVKFNIESSYNRYKLDEESSDAKWRTFRDADVADFYCSVFTGTRGVQLKCHWLDLQS
jgi:thioredoxin reductase